ncbi:MAG TPA: hypothetical protein VG095_07390 [Chthoniobacterales bacterium]|nr:hypothetical protein [Chthoniobacterales bacterium]
MRAVVVLLLLIANAIVSSSSFNPPEPAPPERTDYSLGLLTIVDGAAPAPGSNVVATPLCRRNELSLQTAREMATERRHYRCTGEDARAPLLDIRL